jgi:hypothetical protein
LRLVNFTCFTNFPLYPPGSLNAFHNKSLPTKLISLKIEIGGGIT